MGLPIKDQGLGKFDDKRWEVTRRERAHGKTKKKPFRRGGVALKPPPKNPATGVLKGHLNRRTGLEKTHVKKERGRGGGG